jgi:membrane-associated phospholipid phosphatase
MSHVLANPESVPGSETDPLRRLDAAVIAPHRTRRYRAVAFQAFMMGASVVFVVLALVAHTVAYFPIDLAITRMIQGIPGQPFAQLMHAVSWLGFFPQVAALSAVVTLALFFFGLRWEAVSALFATVSLAVGALVKLVVFRPRPSADLVHVVRELPSSGFPSGHVLSTTAFCGFLVFLSFTLLKSSPGRTAVLVALSLLIALMGPSRIYLGQHWFSDVMGAYLFGSLWLALTIHFYRWGKTRCFVHQPMAPAASAMCARWMRRLRAAEARLRPHLTHTPRDVPRK